MKKFLIALMGCTVLLIGIAFLVLPGPGLPIVATGLAILATDFCGRAGPGAGPRARWREPGANPACAIGCAA